MLKSRKNNGANGEESKFSLEQLDKALLDSFDLMRRVLLETTYLVLGEAAKCIYEDKKLDCNGIDFGIEKRYLTPEVLSTLKDWTTGDITDTGFIYKFEDVPLRFKFIKRKYHFFQYPDIKFYGPETYKLPNPFKTYWKARYLIK